MKRKSITQDKFKYLKMDQYRMACESSVLEAEEYHLHATFNYGLAKRLKEETFQRKNRNNIITSEYFELFDEKISFPSDYIRQKNILDSEMGFDSKLSSMIYTLLPGLNEVQCYILAWGIIKENLYGYIEKSLDSLLKKLKPYLDDISNNNIKTQSSLVDLLHLSYYKINSEWDDLKKKLENI